MQLGNGFCRGRFDTVCHGKQGQHLASGCKQGDRAALFFVQCQTGFDLRGTKSALFNQTVVSQDQFNAMGLRLNATSSQCFEPRQAGVAAVIR